MIRSNIVIGIGVLTLALVGCGANVNNVSKPAADVMNATHRAANATVGRRASGDEHMRMATNISNQLVKQGYGKHVFTFVTGDTAYVAVNQGNQREAKMGVSNKSQIEATVKRIDARVKNVYVSANPQTYARFQGYAKEVNAGRPITAVWDDFRTGVSRMFPAAH